MAQPQQPPYPRGLVKSEGDWYNYQAACYPLRREEGTSMLWNNILIREFPITSGYFIYPVKQTSDLRADSAIYKVRLGSQKTILFVEWKQTTQDIQSGEDQVLLYCQEYLAENPDQTTVYGMTCASTRARIFKVDQTSKSLNPAWNGDCSYVDAIYDDSSPLPGAFEELRNFNPVG